ncbi:MAG: PDDEXK nuclease domain-containing protein [Burkholderiaceae bacterium]|nr:PDDEXK nuclease domain-containing protein [Burkholderiaceae bacterium]
MATPTDYDSVHREIITLVENARQTAARSVNSIMTATYWLIGRRIIELEQGGKARAQYGETLLLRLAKDLSGKFGPGFSRRNLQQMRLFYFAWPIERIWQTVSAKFETARDNPLTVTKISEAVSNSATISVLSQAFPLPWSAYVRLLSVKNESARHFYEIEALRCGWSVRQLDRQIGSQFFERAAMSKNQAAMLEKAAITEPSDIVTAEQAIRDPLVLEFLNLKDDYNETELEEALVHHLTEFMLELGDDFAFVGRQRRLRLDDSWFRVDLLLFHRVLKCLIIIDLKVGNFSYADAGQMHMYLNYANEHWVKPGENPPVGLILCTQKGAAQAHYALDGLPNKVMAAQYQTVLPDEQTLVDCLQRTQTEFAQRANKPVDHLHAKTKN